MKAQLQLPASTEQQAPQAQLPPASPQEQQQQ
jgi:hypothetical protein